VDADALPICDALEPRHLLTAVTGISPINGATAVPVGSNITVTFDVAMNASTVNGSTIQLRNSSNQIVPATVTYNATTRIATLDPTANLPTGNSYLVAKVTSGASGVKDANGVAMTDDVTFAFTTGTPSFSEQTVFSGLVFPTAMEFADDGRVFVAEKSGLIKVFDSLTDTSPTVVADLRTNTHNYWDRGLLGMALDPQFTNGRPYIYVLYTYDGDIGGASPAWGTVNGTSDGGGSSPTGTGVRASGRLSRLTIGAGGVMTGAELVLIHDWVNQFPSHSIGHLQFGPDGQLYASAGDGASFNFADYGQIGNPFNDPANEGGALRAQDVRSNGDPTGLDGSIIRINPNTGAASAGNPITSGDDNAKRIVAYGLRNPLRFTFRPGTSELWVGDVGWSTYEEINRLTAATDSLADNFGWPAFEGAPRQGGYDSANLPLLESLYASGADVKPYYAYHHSDKVVPGSTEPTGGSSITGISFYTGTAYPSAFKDALFFTDYSRKFIYVMYEGLDGLPNVASRQVFKSLAGGATELQTGPNGDMFYVDHNNGRIQRFVSNIVANAAPTAVITADKTTGALPLTVNFSGTSSTDPDPGDTLTYAWDLDGDGQFDDSTSATPSYTYTTSGTRNVQLRVIDRAGVSSTASISINASNSAPVPTITSPLSSILWSVGQTLNFVGSAFDAEDGTLAASRLSWQLVLIHGNEINSSTHEHTIQTFAGVSSGSFITPDHESPSWLELRLTATDSVGTKTTQAMTLNPKMVALGFSTVPGGATITLNGTSYNTAFSKSVIAGSANSTSADSPVTINGLQYNFQSWSDGGAQTHNFTAPATDANVVATYIRPMQVVSSVYINAGGPAAGSFEADKAYDLGGAYSSGNVIDTSGVTNAAPATVYQSERFGNYFNYTVDNLEPGKAFTVRLHFAEVWWTEPGKRVFNVAINGQQVLANFDIFVAAGNASNKAVIRQFNVNADSAGKIVIGFTTEMDNAKVSAIEVIPPIALPQGVKIDAGGSGMGEFHSDEQFTGGNSYETPEPVSIAGVTNAGPMQLYRTERTGSNLTYTLDNLTPGASFTLRLHFAEIWWTEPGRRRFNVAVNGSNVLTNLDIHAAAGGSFKALVRTFSVTANSQGRVVVSLTAIVDQVSIAGLELIPAAGAGPAAPTLNGSSGNGEVKLSWNAVSGATTYSVYRATTTGGQTIVSLAQGITDTSFADATVTNGTTYYYYITAVNANGESAPSNEISTTPRAPSVGTAIDAGGDGSGNFDADNSFVGGGTYLADYGVDLSGVVNPAPERVYRTERFGNMTYTSSGHTPGATFNVRLHFNEVYWTEAGRRTFNVSINGTQVLNNFDIFTAAGNRNFKAVIREFAATADSSGKVTIQFQTVVDNASITGIELVPTGASASQSPVVASLWANGASESRPMTKAEKKLAKQQERDRKREEKLAKKAERQALAAAKKLERLELKAARASQI
jgi:glucose/arabinose dehydrogenase